MFFKPSAHFVICPGPFNRLGVTVVVFGPRRHDVLNEFATTVPGLALQVMMAKAMDQDLSLIEPRRMNRSKARTPPGAGSGEVVLSIAGGMAGITILNQKYALQPAVPLLELFQRLNIVRGIFSLHDRCLHPAGVDDQEYQDVDGPVARVFKLLLLDRTGNRTADRTPFQDLAIGDLINADIPKPLRGQSIGIAVTPQHFLGALFEFGIPPHRFPIACAVRLQVYVVQNTANRRGTDSGHNPIGDRLPRQVLARPGLLMLRQGRPDRDTAVRVMGVSTDQKNRWARRVDWYAGTFVVFVIGLSALQVVGDIDLLGSWWMQGVFPYVILVVIVGLSMTSREVNSYTQRLLNLPTCLFLGRISLALYLVHEPIIQYVAWIARPAQAWSFNMPMPVWGIAVVLPVSVVLATLLERTIETPARNFIKARSRGF